MMGRAVGFSYIRFAISLLVVIGVEYKSCPSSFFYNFSVVRKSIELCQIQVDSESDILQLRLRMRTEPSHDVVTVPVTALPPEVSAWGSCNLSPSSDAKELMVSQCPVTCSDTISPLLMSHSRVIASLPRHETVFEFVQGPRLRRTGPNVRRLDENS